MKRPKIKDYQSKQPPLADYLKFYEYISHLEQYCSWLENERKILQKEIRDLQKPGLFIHDTY